MLGREKSIMVSPAEAVSLNERFGTMEEWYFSKEIFNEWKKTLNVSDIQEPEFSFFKLLSACFNAGRINGIREERAKRG